MNYFWQFDLCAGVIACLLLSETFLHKDIHETKTKWLVGLVMAILVSSIADIPGIYMQNHPDAFNLGVADLSTMVFLTVRNMLPWLYVGYVIALLRLTRGAKRWLIGLVMVPEVIMVLWMLITPTRRMVYYYVDGCVYHRGPFFNVFYVLTAYYVIIGVVLVNRYRRALTLKQRMAFYTFTLLSLVPVVIQGICPILKWSLFFQAIGLFGGFLTIENEDAIRSPMTGLYNRYALVNDSKQLFDVGLKAYVLMIKMPSFHSMALALGQDAIDQVTREMGLFIKNQTPRSWSKYEYGPNQFAIIAYHAAQDQVRSQVKVLQDRFSKGWGASGVLFPTEILITEVPAKASTLEQLLVSMEAPFNPQDPVTRVVYSDEYTNHQYEAKVDVALRKALRENRLMVYYQPIQDTTKGYAHSAEALVRLYDSELGFISPEYFISLAEKNGLVNEIGDYVFEQVCRFLRRCSDNENALDLVEVNLSAVQCMNLSLPKRWQEIMDKYGVKAQQICLELTESAMASSRFNMNLVIDKLRDMGFSFALDDYGTGYANNAYIMSFAFELIKIDKSLLWGADEQPNIDKMLRHTIAMIQDLNMKVVVEGVETMEQRKKLEAAHVEYLQGYLFSKPIPEDEVLHYFRCNVG